MSQKETSFDENLQDLSISETPAQPDTEVPFERHETFKRAFAQGMVLTIILATMVSLYVYQVKLDDKAEKMVVAAGKYIELDDFNSLKIAEKKLKEAEEIQSSNEFVVGALAELYAKQYLFHGLPIKDKASEYVQKAVDDNIGRAERFAAQGYMLVAEGKFDEAKALADELIKKGLAHAKIFSFIGMVKEHYGEEQPARELFRKANDFDFNASLFANQAGNSYLRQGDYTNALFYFGKVLNPNVNQEHEKSIFDSTVALVRNNAQEDRIVNGFEGVWKRGEAAFSPKMLALGKRAQADTLWYLEKYDEALAVAQSSLQINATDPWIYNTLGRIYLALNQVDNAVANAQKSVDLESKNLPFQQDYVHTLIKAQKTSDALGALANLPSKLDDNSDLRLFMFESYLELGDLVKAEEMVNKAKEQVGDTTEVMYSLAKLIYYQESKKPKVDFSKVSNAFQDVLELDGEHPQVFEYMGYVYASISDTAKTEEMLKLSEEYLRKSNPSRRKLKNFYTDVANQLKIKGQTSLAAKWTEKSTKI